MEETYASRQMIYLHLNTVMPVETQQNKTKQDKSNKHFNALP